MIRKLKEDVFKANMELLNNRLVILTWGNVSGFNTESGLVVIKPSGVRYNKLSPDNMVVVDLEGNIVEGTMKPSSDILTHLELYRNFENIGGICHTHSRHAVAWAQADRDIPPMGTTHADYFYGDIPCTRKLSEKEVSENYELNTAKVIGECFSKIDHLSMPAVLVAGHGPFSWGSSPAEAVENSIVLEEVAAMAIISETLGGKKRIDEYLLNKHYKRKHGKDSYYGQ